MPARHPLRMSQHGLSMIELLVSLVLGLAVVLSMLGVYLASRQSFQVNDNLARMQENGRVAFELLLREVRDVGQSPCGSRLTAHVIRVADPNAASWWADTNSGMLRGVDGATAVPGNVAVFGTASAQRVQGTDAIVLMRTSSTDGSTKRVLSHDPAQTRFTLSDTAGLKAGSVVLACDPATSALFRLSAMTTGTPATADHAAGGYNCTDSLGYVNAACTNTTAKTFTDNATLTRWDPAVWFVANNSGGTRSLYRTGINVGAAAVTNDPEEMVRDVQDMTIEYLTRDSLNSGALASTWQGAATFTSGWADSTKEVVAVRIALTLVSSDKLTSAGQRLERRFAGVAALRSRDF